MEMIYKTTRQTPIANLIVSELNASVLTATFDGRTGLQQADLYHSVNSCNKLVAAGTCAPINDTFIKTVTIQL